MKKGIMAYCSTVQFLTPSVGLLTAPFSELFAESDEIKFEGASQFNAIVLFRVELTYLLTHN